MTPIRKKKRRRDRDAGPATPRARETIAGARGFGGTIASDFRRGDLQRSVRRDLRDLYEFYLDDERRARLRRMHRIHRWIWSLGWVLKAMILKLAPNRRLMMVAALAFFVMGDVSVHWGDNNELNFNGYPPAFMLAVIVLMLELRDKLLARDELAVGRVVQLALLPDRTPVVPGWDIWLFTRPANDVGGDLVDHIVLGGGRTGVALGDVSGKGLGAALLMAKLQATLRALAPDAPSLATLGAHLNAIFCRDGIDGRFATLVYTEFGPGDGVIAILNAGHPMPVVVAGGRAEDLAPVALPLGIMPTSAYQEQRVELAPGAMLIIYSDGLSEAENAGGDFFGEERVTSLLESVSGMSAEEAGRRIVGAADAWTGDARQSDDLSLIVIRRGERE